MPKVSDDRQTTLLTIDTVCVEYNLDPWQVLRLIARRNLAAQQVGGDRWRVAPDALVAAMNSTADFDGPLLKSGWFDMRAEANRARRFVGQISELIEADIPENDPGADQIVLYTGKIRQAGLAAPAALLIKMPDQPELPYTTSAGIYAAVQLVTNVHREVQNQRIRVSARGPRAGSMLERVYASPEDYSQIVDAAWEKFQGGSIAVQETYPSGVPGIAETRTFRLRNSDITGISKDEIARLAL